MTDFVVGALLTGLFTALVIKGLEKLFRVIRSEADLKEFAIYFLVQALGYSLITYNFRAIAHGNLAGALASDGINASFNFFVIRRIAKSDDSTTAWLGYVCGSLIGTTIGMYV